MRIDAHNAKCSLTVPGRTHVTVNENLIPTGTEPVDGTKYDLRKDTLLTEQPFDDAWTDLEHAEDGTVTAVFTRPDGKKVRVGGDETVTSFRCAPAPVSGHQASGRRGGGTADGHTRTRSTPAKIIIVIKPGETSSTALFIGMLD